MLPKLKCTYSKDPVPELKKNSKEITKENIDPIRARQLSHNKIKLYSLENKIKILLFNSKFCLILLPQLYNFSIKSC